MEILNYDEQPAGGSIAALFDIYIPAMDITLHRWKAIRDKKNGGFFFGPPSGYKEEQGKKSYPPYVTIGEKRRSDFMKALHDLLRPLLASCPK